MPRRIAQQELEAILNVVGAHAEGTRVGAIREGLPHALPPRMLQRRLALLVDQKRLIAEGQACAVGSRESENPIPPSLWTGG